MPFTYKGKVIKKEYVTETVIHIRIEHIDPAEMTFTAGQYFTVLIDKGVSRAYSIGSSIQDRNFMDTYVDITPGGPGSKFFENIVLGQEVNYIAPMGKFTYEESGSPVIFASTGTGIVPFISMVDSALNSGSTRKMLILQGVRHSKDIYLQDKLDFWKSQFHNFNYEFCITRDESWNGKKGRITEFLPEFINQFGSESVIYTCGVKEAVNSVIDIAKSSGIAEENIKYEKY